MPITFYGSFWSYHSHSQVSKGLVRGLMANGLHDIRLVDVNGYPTTDENDLSVCSTRPEPQGPGFYIGGYPPFAGRWLQGHSPKGALFIAESWVIPEEWKKVAAGLDLLVTPSRWVKGLFPGVGASRAVRHVVHHGLDSIYAHPRRPARHPSPPYHFGHVCGAASFPERKGTPQLLEAFRQVFAEDEAVLDLRLLDVPPARGLVAGLEGDSRFHVTWSTSVEPQDAMRSWYEQLDVLVQPSRAEAFGICPLEARALGIPVVLTAVGGHADHVGIGDVVIRMGDVRPIVVNGIPNGAAPEVSVAAVVRGLNSIRGHIGEIAALAERRAEGYYAKWRWVEVMRKMAKYLRQSERWK